MVIQLIHPLKVEKAMSAYFALSPRKYFHILIICFSAYVNRHTKLHNNAKGSTHSYAVYKPVRSCRQFQLLFTVIDSLAVQGLKV